MILGMTTFTFVHVLLSLIGILSGFVVVFGLLAGKRLDGWTALFLVTTVLTSVTGFLFPFHKFLPSHGVGMVSLVVLSAVPPLMLKTEKNPGGLSLSVFDGLRAALVANRAEFYKEITLPFYGYNRPGAKISEGIREHWWLQGMLGGVKPHYDCIKAFSETDFTEDLKKIDIPVL